MMAAVLALSNVGMLLISSHKMQELQALWQRQVVGDASSHLTLEAWLTKKVVNTDKM